MSERPVISEVDVEFSADVKVQSISFTDGENVAGFAWSNGYLVGTGAISESVGVATGVITVNGQEGNVVLGAADVGALATGARGTTVASLVNGKVPNSQLPAPPPLGVQTVAGKSGPDVTLVAADVGALPADHVVEAADVEGLADVLAGFLDTGAIGTTVAPLVNGLVPLEHLPPISSGGVQSINEDFGPNVTLTAADLGAATADSVTSLAGTVSELVPMLDGKSDVGHTHAALESLATTYQASAERGQPNGYVPLDGTGKVPSSYLPAGDGVAVQDEGSPLLGTGTINFVGDGVTVTNEAGVARVSIPGGGGGGSGDDATPAWSENDDSLVAAKPVVVGTGDNIIRLRADEYGNAIQIGAIEGPYAQPQIYRNPWETDPVVIRSNAMLSAPALAVSAMDEDYNDVDYAIGVENGLPTWNGAAWPGGSGSGGSGEDPTPSWAEDLENGILLGTKRIYVYDPEDEEGADSVALNVGYGSPSISLGDFCGLTRPDGGNVLQFDVPFGGSLRMGSAGPALSVPNPFGSQLTITSDEVMTSSHATVAGNLYVRGNVGLYDTVPVAQPSAIADATDAASTQAAVNALLAAARSVGLIATT